MTAKTNPETTTAEKTTPANKHLSVSIPADVHDALNNYRHDKRIDRLGGVAVQAITTFLQGEGYLPTEPTA